jgi:hypothetical protein
MVKFKFPILAIKLALTMKKSPQVRMCEGRGSGLHCCSAGKAPRQLLRASLVTGDDPRNPGAAAALEAVVRGEWGGRMGCGGTAGWGRW